MTSQDDIDSDFSSAIESDDAERLQQLIQSNGLFAHEDLGGWLVVASYCGKLAVLKLLLELDADVDWKTCDGETAFSYACAYSQFESAKILYEHGANINHVHPTGCTPLDIAVCHGHPAFREWLKSVGGKRNKTHDEWPWPPPAADTES